MAVHVIILNERAFALVGLYISGAGPCWKKGSKAVLVAFDVGKEIFQVFRIRDEIASDRFNEAKLIEHAGKPTISMSTYLQGKLYYCNGTIHTGELLLVPRRLYNQYLYVLYYDVGKNVFRRVEISGLPDYAHQFNDFSCIDTITVSNYEENILSFA
ncbi:hypothetical protein Dsin_009716 [Dipteronia sinensis]|uniref:F-box associated beta-propeller type 3 domain-containing protein n=1 Tax=Dipteronia sinensis TaxID=43782 RepID=A0AAE0AR54_9ROSI|nr:hypothetical protein Dsin_009716 [Dipteronia sinensis]